MEPQRRLALATAAAALAGAALIPAGAEAGLRHPHLRRAIDALRDARAELATGASDFGGHKDAAIGAIDEALRQLHVAIDWADAHGG